LPAEPVQKKQRCPEEEEKKANWNIPELAQPLPIPSTQWVVGQAKADR
jgi:hypothetical protein